MLKVYCGKGNVLLKINEYELAIKSFTEAINVNNRCEQAFIGIGLALNELNKLQNAIDAFNKAIEISYNNSLLIEALCGKAIAFLKLNKFNEALNCLNKILTIDPQCDVAYYGLGIVLNEMYIFKYINYKIIINQYLY